MRFGSVASGIEAASAAWGKLGWEAAWFSEIDPFASAALAHKYPHTHNYGDMTMLPERIESGEVEAPDVFCGGTPCQAFSIAGKRNSLSDARGNLSLVFCEIADAIDAVRLSRDKAPAIVFWENVPGVLSTSDNAFGCFLAGLAGDETPLTPEGCPPAGKSSRYWKWNKATGTHSLSWPVAGCVVGPKRTIAWRVTDAQYFGVAQRRRRVFVVASAREGFDPAEVLFEFDGVRRDIAPSREAGEGAAGTLASRTDGGGFPGTDEACSGYVQPITMAHGQGGAEIGFDRGPTLTCNHEAPIAAYSTKIHNTSSNQSGKFYKEYTTGLEANSPPPAVCAAVLPFDTTQVTSPLNYSSPAYGDPCHPLAAGAHVPAVATPMQVRRLTPVECERLQGFPDNYTLIPWRNKPAEDCPDGPRYKALGNSWAVPNVFWIGQRIDNQLFGETLI